MKMYLGSFLIITLTIINWGQERPRGVLNGGPVRLQGTARVFIIDQGKKREIPDLPTYQNLYDGDPATVVPEYPGLDKIPLGSSVTAGAVLMHAPPDPRVYFIEGNVKREIGSWGVFYGFGFQKRFIKTVSSGVLEGKQPGVPLLIGPGGGIVEPAISDEVMQLFPLKFRREDNFGGHHMATDVVVSINGRFDAVTETNNHVALKGNCGTVTVWLLDKNGNILTDPKGGQQYCVDGKLIGRAVRHDVWNFSISPAMLKTVAGVAIMHANGSKNFLDIIRSHAEKAQQVVQACPACVAASL